MTPQQFSVANLQELKDLIPTLLPFIQRHRKIAFVGEMGAGKTTLIKLLCAALGALDSATSPTFAIINVYATETVPIHHMDLYRLNSEEEGFSIGLLELFDDNSYCFIEWPQVMEAYLPEETLWLTIEVGEEEERFLHLQEEVV
ncbi:MAG: tRNA (adenosine(37)-N6)-threonylcarbamoyltransferase complex ATPase subunit type 1 TsaE [Aureispira sp.]